MDKAQIQQLMSKKLDDLTDDELLLLMKATQEE
jgi:hypothetical protein